MKTTPILTDALSLTLMASRFAALGSEQRLNVLRLLVRAGPDGLTMGDLGARSGVIGSTLTHHLKVLSVAGLARQVKQGRQILCFGPEPAEMQLLSNFLLQQCCADAAEGHTHAQHR